MGLHRALTGRSVPVVKKSVEEALSALSNSMKQHGLFTKIRQNRRFEKPTTYRRRKEVGCRHRERNRRKRKRRR